MSEDIEIAAGSLLCGAGIYNSVFELQNGEHDPTILEERLQEALSKIDEYVQERADLLEDLEATKHSLLEIQQKLKEKEMNMSASPLDKSFKNSTDLNKSQNSSLTENNAEDGAHFYKRLIRKLEKKNVELERDLENTLSAKNKEASSNIELQSKISFLEDQIKELQLQLSNKVEQSSKKEDAEVQVHIVDHTQNPERKHPCLTFTTIQSINIPSQKFETIKEPVQKIENSSNGDSNRKSVSLEDKSDLKQENEYLKSRIDVLTADVTHLKTELKDIKNLNIDLKNQLKEKDTALSDAQLDIRISSRKEQQSDSIKSSLRDQNKELREKVKSLELTVNEKTKSENELKEKIYVMELQLSNALKEVEDKQKFIDIEKAKAEERTKAMQYTCEMSKDVTQKLVKTHDHYEEVIKKNMDLMKENEESSRKNSNLLEEVTQLKNEIALIKKEKTKLEKLNSVLKSACIELEDQAKDLEIIIEARERIIRDLQKNEDVLKAEIKDLKEVLKVSKAETSKAEKNCEELRRHIEDLNSEIDSNNFLLESEVKNLNDQLSHYKKVTANIEALNASLQKELNLQNLDIKNYCEKILNLESQLCEIKEEAARHITQISSLKSSNFKLTQSLEDALEQNKMAHQDYEGLLNELDSIKATHNHEKVKLQETIAQQTKLIDFMQSKAENMEKRRKPYLPRLFGKKDNSSNVMPMQYKDVEKLLETEKSRCRRLQDQLSQARAEVVALQREIHNVKSSSINVEVPVSPVTRAMHCVITQSPSHDSTTDSPVLVSKDIMNKFTKPPGMKHKIPHRFTNNLCMKSTKCSACLDSLHFGRPVSKCEECAIICHPACSASLPSTCGLPFGFMEHFRKSVNSSSNSEAIESSKKISEGWIKLPKSNKLGWDRKYLRVMDNMLCFFEDVQETDPEKAVIKLNFSPDIAKMVVTSAVSPTELTFAASSDLPYVLKLEYIPHTTCWPQRCLYIMTMSFVDKQMWVSTLEALAEENQSDVDGPQKSKLISKTLWTMKGERLIEPLCTSLLDENIILLGAADGLYVLKIVNQFTCSLKSKIDGFQYVYQIDCVKNIGLMILIQGNERRITTTQLTSVQSAAQKLGNHSLVSKPLSDINDCHLFSVDSYHTDAPYICIATSKAVLLLQWDTVLKMFCNKKVFDSKEPCSCIHFTPNSVIFGTDSFYELDLSTFTLKKFLDDKDSSLAGLIYGASQFRSFPVAIFQVSSPKDPAEYLMCFHEMGVFVNSSGQRTRADDMKWSRLPLSFAYHLPYLFVTHFNSIEVVEIPPLGTTESGLQAVTLVQNPQYLGSAHLEQSIYLSSCHDQIIELLLIDGSSIGSSEFILQQAKRHSLETYSTGSSGKESIPESEALEFSFSTSIDQSLAEFSVDQASITSQTSSSSESVSSQN